MTAGPSSSQPTPEFVLESLVAHGAPLLGWSAAPAPLPLEETVVRSLFVARSNATVLRVLPALMAKRAADFQQGALKSWAAQLGEEAVLGFVLDLSQHLFGTQALTALRNELVHAQRPGKADFFFHSESDSVRGRRLAEARTPASARAWGLRMNMPELAFWNRASQP